MSEKNSSRAAANPMDLWRQWFETGTGMWSNVFGGSRENYLDPYGLYRQWFQGLEGAWKQMTGSAGASPFATMTNNPFMAALNPATAMPGSATSQNAPGGPMEAQQAAATMGAAEAQNLWKQWFEAVNGSWQEAGRLGTAAVELAPRYVEMLEHMRHNFLSAEGYPADPLQLATRWYNATNGPLSEFIGELTEREEFLEPSSQFLKSYASFYSVFKRNSEEYLKALQLPVRSDIARVAGLVIALEDKIDRIEDAFEDFEYGYAAPATAEAVGSIEERIGGLEQALERAGGDGADGPAAADSIGGLESRLDGVEAKIDRLLAALENAPQNGGAQAEASQEEEEASETDGDVQATAAARRKAQELGVELSEVEGTGTNGQITVDDVRREGQS